MKKFYVLNLALFLSLLSNSQTITWAVPSNFPGQQEGLITDNSSNVYQYGFTFNAIPEYNISQGSVIRKFSSNGTFMKDVIWNTKFFLNKMAYDGTGNFYFIGEFEGTITLDGHSVTSNGKLDGAFGKMDESGKVLWLRSFGGAENDLGRGLTLNQAKTELIVTGSLDSNAFIGSTSVGMVEKNMFIGVFDLDGAYIKHKLFDFDAQRTDENKGLEIVNNATGYFLLGDREGAEWWKYPMPPGPEQGRYVFSLDPDFNILWSEFIISQGCYYGYSCKNMSAGSGDAYVPKFCSGKYGGQGQLCRRSGLTGVPTWSLNNPDGSYHDTYSFDNTLYYIGIEDANGCPCPDHDFGNAVVKTLAPDNTDRLLLKIHDYLFYNITRAPNGSIYVSGDSNGDDATIAQFHLQSRKFIFAMKDPINSVAENPVQNVSFNIFPNPSLGKFEISATKQIDELIVMNVSGRVINRQSPNAFTSAVSDLKPGCYVVQLKSGGNTEMKKVIVCE